MVRLGNRHFWLSGFLALAACDQAPAPPAKAKVTDMAPRFAPAAIDEARAAIAAEPKVKSLHFSADKYGIEWQVAVISDGSARHGFADYICILLASHQAIDQDVEVRIVDAMLIDRGNDPRSASLGTVRCSDGTRLDDAPALLG